MKFRFPIRISPHLLTAAILSAAIPPVAAHSPVIHAITQAVFIAPAGADGEDEAAPGDEARERPAPEQPGEPAAANDKPLAQKLLALPFDRSPRALLSGSLKQRDATADQPETAFALAVLFGDWQTVGGTLAGLPADDAAKVYAKLLNTIAKQAVPVGEVLKTPGQASPDEDPFQNQIRIDRDREQRAGRQAPFLSEDFYGLVNASPTDINGDLIGPLAQLVKTALGEGGRAKLLETLKTGWKGMGGDSPEGARLATLLLSTVGWIEDAAPFLPLEREQWDGADSMQLVFAMEYFTQTGISGRDERQLQRAAELCAFLMKTGRFGSYTRPQFKLAMDRLVLLLPALEPAQARELIREQLFKQTATLADLVTIIGDLGLQAATGSDLKARNASLGTQRLILDALATMQGPLPPNVPLLVMNWLFEAEGCYRAGGVVATEMTQTERMMAMRYGLNRQQQVTTLATDQILATAPPPEVTARLNAGLAQRVELTLLKVNVLKPDEADLDLLRSYIKKHPGLEREVCQDVLSGWVSKRTKPAESEQVKRLRAYGMYVPPQMLQQGSGIPLTRLRQNQNIQHFKKLLGELRAISPEPLDPGLIVQAFMTLHSGAEVYQLADIEAIFGPPEKMDRRELLNLLGGMRQRLGEQWRDPQTQAAAGTNRTEEEAKDEVSRGYHTALTLAQRGIPDGDKDWESLVTRGQLFYDASQYEFERQVKLEDYVNLRDSAFGSFRMAAEAYAAKLADLPRGQWNIGPYQAWFFVMLGASDLAQLTSNTARADPGLTGIGDAMRALPGEAAARHLELFAEMLGELFPRVPPNVRQRFLSAGLRIVGEDNPAAAAATRSLAYYQELLDEIQLRLTVDGPTSVGHTQPFGVVLSLESTRQLLRESGGFARYIQAANPQQQAMGGGPGGARNLREDFTKNIKAALEETFEVVSIMFHDGAPKTIDLEREGWVETPLAYLVLKAKTPAVDRIPSIQLDMDFIDQPGQVVLPVMSQLVPVNARDEAVPPRPCPDLALVLSLDQREWKDGRITVDIQARGKGIIASLDELFETAREGFELEVVDSTLSVSRFASDGKNRSPEADRNWQLIYRRKADLSGTVDFRYPKLKPGVTPASIDYRHYQDTDLITLDAANAAAGVQLTSTGGQARQLGAWVAGALVLLVLLVWLARRGKRPVAVKADEFAIPAEPTPFATISFLRRVIATHGGSMKEADHAALATDIARIEAGFFSGGPAPTMDLADICRKWFKWVKRAH
ncbi:MAG: hypothetical protein MUF04_00870 [Akkermansiaceae bacterium]|nr:hypothetical protein [Akkermansiaceae bacterium]